MQSRTYLAIFVAAALPSVVAASESIDSRVRGASLKTVRLIEKVQDQWQTPCLSCHNQGLGMWAIGSARRHGLPVNEKSAADHGGRTWKIASTADFALLFPPEVTAGGLNIAGGAEQGITPNFVSRVFEHRTVLQQLPNGTWPLKDFRPPHGYSEFTATAFGIRFLQRDRAKLIESSRSDRLARATKWLTAHDPVSIEDHTFQLLGLIWANASQMDIDQAAAALARMQAKDGSWSQLPAQTGDAYATGEALYALQQAGKFNKQVSEGIEYLLRTQANDGSWHVKSALYSPARISPPYAESGFPYARDQYISFAGTAWALIAMAETLPRANEVAPVLPSLSAEIKGVTPWMETAIFGSSDDLRALLDAGLDANASSGSGVSLLMLSVADPSKVRLLLDRGADVNAKTKGDDTALALAAEIPGNLDVVNLLLAKGAEVQIKAEKPEAQPLAHAIAAGTLDVVRLLAGNARFDQPGMVDVIAASRNSDPAIAAFLIERGANVNQVDETKMTSLMWAAVTHRPNVIKMLLEHGADPAMKDALGFTAVDHAKSIRFLENETLEALKTKAITSSKSGLQAKLDR